MHEHGEKKTAAGEKIPLYQDRDIPYDKNLHWRRNAENLLKQTIKPKYHDRMNELLKNFEEEKFSKIQGDVATLALKDGVLIFFDEDGEVIPSCSLDIKVALERESKNTYIHDCRLCERETRKRRRWKLGRLGADDEILTYMATRSLSGKKNQHGPKPDPRSVEVNAKLNALFEERRADRESTLQAVMEADDEGYDITAGVDEWLRGCDAEEFASRWPDIDYSHDVDEVLRTPPNPKEGTHVNPFIQLNWTPETVRQLIQEWYDERVFFHEAESWIYDDRFGDFKKDLVALKVPENMLETLEDEDYMEDDDLTASYKNCKKLLAMLDAGKIPADPEEAELYKKLYPKREHLRMVVQVMGDYIYYTAKLVNAISKLQKNLAEPAERRRRRITGYKMQWIPGATDKDAPRYERADTPENGIKAALHEVFDAETPRAFEGELLYLLERTPILSILVDEPREITFQDLRGNTATVSGEWFTNYAAPEALYADVYGEIAEQTRKENGSFEETITPERATEHFNDLLQLGICAYASLPDHRSPKEIIDELTKAGVKNPDGSAIRYEGNTRKDARNLFRLLAVKSPQQILEKNGDAGELLHRLRINFIRVGSIVWKKQKHTMRERYAEAREAKMLQVVKLSAEQAADVMTVLKDSGRFTQARLDEIQRTLIGGVGMMLSGVDSKTQITMTAAAYRLDLGDGWAIMIGGGGSTVTKRAIAGGGISKTFSAREDIDITIMAGGGAVFGKGMAPGWNVGLGGAITKKFSAVDLTFHSEVGVSFFGDIRKMLPSISGGVAVDWTRLQEGYEENLTKREAELHINELDRVADKYLEVKSNPAKYPEFYEFLVRIDDLKILDSAAKKIMFENAYEIYKEGLRSETMSDSAPLPFQPMGVGFGMGATPLGPFLFAFVEFALWHRKVVYRIASSEAETRGITEARSREALLEREKEGKVKVSDKTLGTSGDLLYDHSTNTFSVSSRSEASPDFDDLFNNFQRFQKELGENAKMFVDAANLDGKGKSDGLVRLQLSEAYGVARVFVDSSLGDDVMAVAQDGELYLSVKKGKKIFIRREDLNFPFKERGEIEESVVYITDNPYTQTEQIKANSAVFLEQRQGRQWIKRPRAEGEERLAATGTKQENIKTLDEYRAWWGTGKEGRLEYETHLEKSQEYRKLAEVVLHAFAENTKGIVVRDGVRKEVDRLIADKAFLTEVRKLSTNGVDLIRAGKADVHTDTRLNMPELTKLVATRIGLELNAEEMHAVLLTLTVASFRDLAKDAEAQNKDAEDLYKEILDAFHKPLFQAIYAQSGGAGDSAAAAAWVFEQFKDVDPKSEAKPVETGAYFGTLVGMDSITGLRTSYDWRYMSHDEKRYGMLGEKALSLGAKDVSGDVARFWLRTLSPYKTGMQNQPIPAKPAAGDKKAEKIYEDYQTEMQRNLISPLTLKLLPLVAQTMSASEIRRLRVIYEKGREGKRVDISGSNLHPVKVLFNACDKVREAQLAGKTEADIGSGFVIKIETKVSHGIFQLCGNPTGVVRESFTVSGKDVKEMPAFAAMAEGDFDVQTAYSMAVHGLLAGAALPFTMPRMVEDRPAGPPETPPLPEGPERPAPPAPEAPPEPITVEEVRPTPSAEGGTGAG